MTSMRARAIDVAAAAFREAGVRAPRTQASTAVDALLAAGMLADPEECARTYSLISELIATGKDDDAERAYRLAVKAWRRARDVADGKLTDPTDPFPALKWGAHGVVSNILRQRTNTRGRPFSVIAEEIVSALSVPRDDETTRRASNAPHGPTRR